MEELFLETQDGLVPLDRKIIEKYKLKKGSLSPFTNCRIVDKNGNFETEKKDKKKLTAQDGRSVKLTTSEQIDFSQGADSD